jgi:hypothetical protein
MILVIGAGAAGMATAFSAALHGIDVTLVENTASPGGTVTRSLIHTLGGLYDSAGRYINNGLTTELAERLTRATPLARPRKIGKTWTLSVSPEIYRRVTEDWLASQDRIRVISNCRVTRIETQAGSVTGVELRRDGSPFFIEPEAMVDTTGTAEAIRLIDPGLVLDEPEPAAAGLIFRLSGVNPEVLKFPSNIDLLRSIRAATEKGILPDACRFVWIDKGVSDTEAYLKLSVPLGADWRNSVAFAELAIAGEKILDSVLAFLRERAEFSEAEVSGKGELGVREGGRIRGDYCLTADDVRSGRKFVDAACRCCWPIEYWNPRTGVELEYLPPDTYYEIPLRSLKVSNLRNVWAAGKCLSAERLAQASARVVGCCWAMGEAVGNAIASGKRGAE